MIPREACPPVLIENHPTCASGLDRQEHLADAIPDEKRPALLMWRSPPALIVGRGDTRLPRFEAAVEKLAAEGWPVLVRNSGGLACPVSPGTLQIALARRVVPGGTTEALYEELARLLIAALSPYGLEAVAGERPDAFCPGRYDISLKHTKIAGLSQRWRQRSGAFDATTAAALIIDGDPSELARITNLFYRTAGAARVCSAGAVGSMKAALSPHAPETEILFEEIAIRVEALIAAEPFLRSELPLATGDKEEPDDES
ncbi:lipoate--protein ligase family protein [Consotaella salsifontis]|uniref:BPL/LPL catalytic domain-containing protein n=1 Tax=Consotaella salsifontis TaxID=1365950 RepID=A0A1T4SMW7_9HYPH|nr:hypothetical protein [Consotaella salsifontis]SKA29503.1 hypothetical protein SAMN05428963_11232 [Consotaella salsifontis]